MTSPYECSLCYLLYNDRDRHPLLIALCGHTFCAKCLGYCQRPRCPLCRVAYDPDSHLIRNYTVAEIVREYKRARIVQRTNKGWAPRLSIFQKRRSVVEPISSSHKKISSVAQQQPETALVEPEREYPQTARDTVRTSDTIVSKPRNPFLQILTCSCSCRKSKQKDHRSLSRAQASLSTSVQKEVPKKP